MIFPEIGYISDKGNVRKENQDRVLVLQETGRSLCVVADGMGGTENGAMASDVAVKRLKSWWISCKDTLDKLDRKRLTDLFYEALIGVNEAVVRCCRIQKIKAGTTLTALLIVDDFALAAYSGDTRLYRVRGKKISQLSEDETLYNYFENYETEAVNSGKNKSILISYIGKENNFSVNLYSEEVIAGDIFIICSDGAYNYLNFENEETLERLKVYPPDALVKMLANEIKKQKASDNLSIIIAKCR